jgi:integrase
MPKVLERDRHRQARTVGRSLLCGPLMRRWGAKLTNRSRGTDLCRLELHVVPYWKRTAVADIDLPAVVRWLDAMADAGELGPQSLRHLLGLLSRFLNWCVVRGHVERNVVRDLPPGSRPRVIPPPPESIPWVKSDDQALEIMRALPAPFDVVFYLGNRCGLRLGEILGLRLADVAELEAGAIRVAHSYDGPLKEDRHGAGKAKWVPAPADAIAVIRPIDDARRGQGAGPESLLLVDQDGAPLDRHQVAYRWRVVRRALGLPAKLSFYKASRHSFASRALASGAGVDEISAALGHSSPAITAKHYLHFVRKTFSPILRAGLGLDGAPGAKVIALPARQLPAAAPAAAKGGDHAA